MNLTKYFMIEAPMDDTFGPTDMPAVWNLQKYQPERGMFLNLAGDSHDAYSVVIDSALGLLGAAPHDMNRFLGEVKWMHDYLASKPAPSIPLPSTRRKPRPVRRCSIPSVPTVMPVSAPARACR